MLFCFDTCSSSSVIVHIVLESLVLNGAQTICTYLSLFFAIVIVIFWCVQYSKYSKFTFAAGSAHLLLLYKVEQFSLPLITKCYYFERLRSRIVCHRNEQLLLQSHFMTIFSISFTLDLRITICNQAFWNRLTNMPILRPDFSLLRLVWCDSISRAKMIRLKLEAKQNNIQYSCPFIYVDDMNVRKSLNHYEYSSDGPLPDIIHSIFSHL